MDSMVASASSSSSSSPSSFSSKTAAGLPTPPLPTHYPPQFTPIQECEMEENEEEGFQERTPNGRCTATARRNVDSRHHPTPLHEGHGEDDEKGKESMRRLTVESGDPTGRDRGVSCNICRPSTREKISVVPLDNNGLGRHSVGSPNGMFKSIFSYLVRKSPRSSEPSPRPNGDEQWKIAIAELSQKLIQATRKRDEAILEASRLKYSMAELEKKLNMLEIYCQNLKSGLEECSGNSACKMKNTDASHHRLAIGDHDTVIEHFLVSVSEARSSVRLLSRSLTLQLRQMGSKVYDRISLLLQPYDIKISLSKNPRSLHCYLEALLNKAFFEEFEAAGFQKSAPTQILNPMERCEANLESFNRLQGLTWEEVLNRGTRHFSQDFSRFCDRKMSEIVAMLGWNRAWPEPLLQAFFGASKSVWLVHLLANSVHPTLPIFRVDTGVRFDSVYMEDMGADKARKLVPDVVRIMVAPGFYVYGSVVKCKVLCRYQSSNCGNSSNHVDKGLTPSPLQKRAT